MGLEDFIPETETVAKTKGSKLRKRNRRTRVANGKGPKGGKGSRKKKR